MRIYRKQNRNLLFIIILLLTVNSHQYLCAQVKETIATENGYILSKFPYPKTSRIEEIYCNKYSSDFDCGKIETSNRGMFPEFFNLTDDFFVKILLRPIDKRNYDALNIAGLYLRKKRPEKEEVTFEYTFLDIELEHFTNRVYSQNKKFSSSNPDEVEFRLAFLDLIEENLFLNPEQAYVNELTRSNNFKGSYYALSRMFFANTLIQLRQIEKNEEVLRKIQELLVQIPED